MEFTVGHSSLNAVLRPVLYMSLMTRWKASMLQKNYVSLQDAVLWPSNWRSARS